MLVPAMTDGRMPRSSRARRTPRWQQTDLSDLAEGLYLKTESQGEVTGRYKWVRPDFVQTILDSGSHHSRRPVLPNQLAPGVDLYAPTPQVGWQDLGLRTFRDPAELTTTRRPR